MLKRGSFIVFVILVPLGFLIWRRDNDVFRSLKLRAKVENCLRAEEMCKRGNLKILGSWYRSRILNVGGDVQGMLLAILSDPKEEPPLRRYAARALVTLNMRGALPVLEGLRSYGDLYSRGLASWAVNKLKPLKKSVVTAITPKSAKTLKESSTREIWRFSGFWRFSGNAVNFSTLSS